MLELVHIRIILWLEIGIDADVVCFAVHLRVRGRERSGGRERIGRNGLKRRGDPSQEWKIMVEYKG